MSGFADYGTEWCRFCAEWFHYWITRVCPRCGERP